MERTCPNCDRHCPIDDLHCGRGKEYFGLTDGSEHGMEFRGHSRRGHEHEHGHGGYLNDDPRVIQLLHRCGHELHHGDMDVAERMLYGLSPREQRALEQLLEKCLAGLPERKGHR